MAQKVRNVQELYDSARYLLKNVVLEGDSSADQILYNLNSGIENLKANWKGMDAGLRIQEVINVHNAMVAIRNALAELSVESYKVANMYREIQISNGAGLESFEVLSFDPKTNVDDITDNADTIDINEAVNDGKNYIDSAKNAIDSFKNNVQSRYEEIMGNWTEGPGRETATQAFDTFMSHVGEYGQVLESVSSNITIALQNYSI